ncbi:putative nucleoside diphosphate kinase 7, nucleoside diphosphate kinase-like domain superfamily [Plasmopara halstedii]
MIGFHSFSEVSCGGITKTIMDEVEQLAFFVEWNDPQSGLRKNYIMYYQGDNTVELVDRQTKRIFLKRIRIPTVSLDNLFAGSFIIVYSRQLKILEPANDYTRKKLQQREDKAVFVITPDGYSQMGRIIHLIEQSGLYIRNLQMVNLQKYHIAKLEALTSEVEKERQCSLLEDVSVLVEVRLSGPKVIDDIKLKLVAADIDTVLVARTELEIFCSDESASDHYFSTALLNHCTLCLIRPRIVQEAGTGEILDAILTAGFEISALKLVHLRMDEADELFQIYRGLMRQYHEMLKYMCSSPCLALEVRGEDVVHRFRDFCGPFDVQVAKILQPQSLRAKYGRSIIYNALHCTDCNEDGVLECQYIFKALSSQ